MLTLGVRTRDYSVASIRRYIENQLGLKKHSLDDSTERIASLLSVILSTTKCYSRV